MMLKIVAAAVTSIATIETMSPPKTGSLRRTRRPYRISWSTVSISYQPGEGCKRDAGPRSSMALTRRGYRGDPITT